MRDIFRLIWFLIDFDHNFFLRSKNSHFLNPLFLLHGANYWYIFDWQRRLENGNDKLWPLCSQETIWGHGFQTSKWPCIPCINLMICVKMHIDPGTKSHLPQAQKSTDNKYLKGNDNVAYLNYCILILINRHPRCRLYVSELLIRLVWPLFDYFTHLSYH